MPIAPELQAKIDALDDEKLRAKLIDLLAGPYIKEVSDEEIFNNIVANHESAKEYLDGLKKWTSDEVSSFSEYFKSSFSSDYDEFIRQERDTGEIQMDMVDTTFRVILKWAPDLSLDDQNELFGDFRKQIKRIHT